MDCMEIHCEHCGEIFETHDERDNMLVCDDCENRDFLAEFVDSFYRD